MTAVSLVAYKRLEVFSRADLVQCETVLSEACTLFCKEANSSFGLVSPILCSNAQLFHYNLNVAAGNTSTRECGCVPIKLYLQCMW